MNAQKDDKIICACGKQVGKFRNDVDGTPEPKDFELYFELVDFELDQAEEPRYVCKACKGVVEIKTAK